MLREYPNNNCKISQFFFRNGENHVIFGVGPQVATDATRIFAGKWSCGNLKETANNIKGYKKET